MLSEDQIKHFKELLLAEKAKLEKELSGIADKSEDSGEYTVRYQEMGNEVEDAAEEYRQHEVNLTLEKELEVTLKDVNDALARIESGTYGVSEKSGKEINIKRLEAYPAARYTIEEANE